MIKRDQTEHILVCDVCIAMTTDGIGWKAMLTIGDEDAEDVQEVVVCCPACAAREFYGEPLVTRPDALYVRAVSERESPKPEGRSWPLTDRDAEEARELLDLLGTISENLRKLLEPGSER